VNRPAIAKDRLGGIAALISARGGSHAPSNSVLHV
jgi:hypothetical protein